MQWMADHFWEVFHGKQINRNVFNYDAQSLKAIRHDSLIYLSNKLLLMQHATTNMPQGFESRQQKFFLHILWKVNVPKQAVSCIVSKLTDQLVPSWLGMGNTLLVLQ
jgi:hypothetical protein